MSGYTVEAAGAIVVFAVLRLFVRLLIHFNLCRVIVSHAATDSVFCHCVVLDVSGWPIAHIIIISESGAVLSRRAKILKHALVFLLDHKWFLPTPYHAVAK